MDDGCGPAQLLKFDIEQSVLDGHFGMPRVIRKAGTVASSTEARSALPGLLEPVALPPGLSLQLTLLPPLDYPDTYVQLLYSSAPIAADETDWDLFLGRAMNLTESPGNGQTAEVIKQALGARAQVINVGPHRAAVTHDDNLPNGADTYTLWWSDEELDYWLKASTTPAEAVDVVRSMYCAG